MRWMMITKYTLYIYREDIYTDEHVKLLYFVR
jgi:hypothetical protein